MTKTCEAMYFEELKQGRPIWGTGEKKMTIVGRDDGWRPCRTESEGEVKLFGRQYLVCKEHKRQIELLKRDNSPLLGKIRWTTR